MPTIAEALTLALEHHLAGRLEPAEVIYRQILDQHPANGDALHLLGALVLQSGRSGEAIDLLQQAVAIAPTNSTYLGNLGSAYVTAGRDAEARQTLDEALRCDPTNADAHYNLAIVCDHYAWLDPAATNYRKALELRPENSRARNNLANLLRVQGKLDEALVHVEAALALDPQMAHAHFNRALILLSQGRLAEGWIEYEWWPRCFPAAVRPLPQPTWQGEPLGEQTLLVRTEQGLGDTIQFLRYLPQVRKRCRNVLVDVAPRLMPLLRQSGIEPLVAQLAADTPPGTLPPADFQVSMLSLPWIFGTTLDNIPAEVPYLHANQELEATWREKLSSYRGCKVGIAWQGRTTYADDRFRSIPLVCFAPLAAVPGVRLLSLQKGPGADQILAPQAGSGAVDLGNGIDEAPGAFMDTSAIMKNLDLVITSDTSIAHLAGALGVPVWVALCAGPDWRWLTERRDSPWYPTMRLFRQRTLGDWQPVFKQMAGELAAIVGQREGDSQDRKGTQ